MKKTKKYSHLFAATVLVSAAVAPVAASAEETEGTQSNDRITVANNVTKADTVTVKNVPARAKVTIYDATGENVLVSKTATKLGDLVITIPNGFAKPEGDSSTGDTIQVSLTEYLKAESKKVIVAVPKEAQSAFSDETESVTTLTSADVATVTSGQITVVNNVVLKDQITVTGLAPKDVIKVYNAAGDMLKKATVAAKKDSVTIVMGKFAADLDAVYITKTTPNTNESEKIQITLAPEAKSAALTEDNNIKAVDALKGKDTVVVEGVEAKDVVTVYTDETKESSLGKVTVGKNATKANINVKELKTYENVYVAVKKYNEHESDTFEVEVEKPTPTVATITKLEATNVIKGKDTVKVTGVKATDVVRVYNASDDKEIGKATVKKGATEVTITTKELTGVSEVYVTVESKGFYESTTADAASVDVKHPEVTSIEGVTVKATNAVSGKDSVVVEGLSGAKATVKVFSDAEGKTLIGKAAVKKDVKSAAIKTSSELTTGTKVYVSIEEDGKLASSAATADSAKFVVADVKDPSQTTIDSATVFTVTNKLTGKDTVVASKLAPSAIVKVYAVKEDGTKGDQLGKGTAKANGTLTISLAKGLPSDKGSKVFVTVQNLNELESATKEVEIVQPEATATPDTAKIEITNNVTKADTLKVTGLVAKDVVKVYKDGETAGTFEQIGTATVGTGKTEATVNIKGKAKGFNDLEKVYVSITSTNKAESAKVEVEVTPEKQSDDLTADKFTFTNNVVIKDKVEIKGLSKGDVIKIFTLDGTQFAKTTATKAGDLVWTLSKQLPTETTADTISVKVTIQKTNELESKGVVVDFAKEKQSATLATADVVQVNNSTGADKLTIKGLKAKDVVTIYSDAAKATTALGKLTATAANANGHVVSLKNGLPTGEDAKIYVFVKRYNELESEALVLDVNEVPESEF